MKIATFNINNVNHRLANLLAWLDRDAPDVVCLQELKAEDLAFPLAEVEKAGYGAVWVGQRTWNGVAILAKGADPVLTRTRLPGAPIIDALKGFLDEQLRRLPGGSVTAEAIRYVQSRWDGLTRFLDDGCIELDTNPGHLP